MDAIKTIKEIAQEVGVSKQAVFKRMSKEPLKSALASLDNGIITSESNKIYLSDSAVDLLKSAFWEKYATKDIKKSPASTYSGASTFFMSENSLSTPEEAHVKVPVVHQQEPPPRKLAEEQDFINLLKNQLKVKDQQLMEKDEQIQAKDKQIGEILKTVNELADVLKCIHEFMAKMSDETSRQPAQTTVVNDNVKELAVEPSTNHSLNDTDSVERILDILPSKEVNIPIHVNKTARIPDISITNRELDTSVDNIPEVFDTDEEFLDDPIDDPIADDPVADVVRASHRAGNESDNPLSNTARILDVVNRRSNSSAKPIDFKNIVAKPSPKKAKAAPVRSIEDDFDFLLKRRLSSRRD